MRNTMTFPRSRPLRWFLLGLIGTVGLGHAQGVPLFGQVVGEADVLREAQAVHQRAITLDTHVDIAGPEYATPQLDPGVDNPRLKCDLVKMAAGGVDGVFLAAYVAQGRLDAEHYHRAYRAAADKIAAIRRLATTMYPGRCELATTPAEVERIVGSGKRAIMIGIENGYAIGTDLSRLQEFYDLGVRYLTLCHNGHNQICDSCNPAAKLGDKQAEHNGLSPFGRQVVAEMNRLGMMVDVSHAAPSSFRDVVAISQAPIIASHSGCGAINDHPRNLDDEQLKRLAANGGVIQIVAVASFLKSPSPERKKAIAALAREIGIAGASGDLNLTEASQQQRDRFEEQMREINRQYPQAGLKDFVDHIDHAVKVAGIDHVGIGSDFDGGGGIDGFQHHGEALRVTAELLRRGYTAEAIEKIWGRNLLRVWGEVEKQRRGD